MDLLIIDDDNDFRRTAARRLKRRGYRVRDAETPAAGLDFVRKQGFEVALVDLMMPVMNGIEFMAKLKEIDASCEVVMLTGEATVETAVAAMKRGAFDYLTKPCPFDELEVILQKAYAHHRLGRENVQLRAALDRAIPAKEIVGETAAIRDVLRMLKKVGPTASPVLIQGESGTGKELVARALHRLSNRAEKPMVTVNCAALQESLLESEMFGHEKGAFTGATSAKLGLFDVADGGTLFVDELGELAGGLQAKLLRVLEDGSLRRVGSIREQTVDVRIIAATNRDLNQEVAEGRFRDDLYYRLNVLTIQMPPLRDLRDDIPLLIEHFLRKAGSHWQITDEARASLCNYRWPGNVRELANVLERATILADDDTIGPHDLPETISYATRENGSTIEPVESESDNLESRERRHIQRVLQREGYNRNRTAQLLGINRRSLYRLIEKYEIEIPDKGSNDKHDG